MTNIPIHIVAHHLSLSPALCEFVQSKIGTVTRFASDAMAVEIVLRRNPGIGAERFAASARLVLPGRDVHGSASSSDIYEVIGKVASRLARLSRKRKTRQLRSYNLGTRLRGRLWSAGRRPVAELKATSERVDS